MTAEDWAFLQRKFAEEDQKREANARREAIEAETIRRWWQQQQTLGAIGAPS